MRLRGFIARSIRWLLFNGLIVTCLGAVNPAELRYGVKGLPVSLGNPYVADGLTADSVLNAIFDGVTQLDINGNPILALALS